MLVFCYGIGLEVATLSKMPKAISTCAPLAYMISPVLVLYTTNVGLFYFPILSHKNYIVMIVVMIIHLYSFDFAFIHRFVIRSLLFFRTSILTEYMSFHLEDCRICVWNAVDGSLVHSLTGHTESVRLIVCLSLPPSFLCVFCILCSANLLH